MAKVCIVHFNIWEYVTCHLSLLSLCDFVTCDFCDFLMRTHALILYIYYIYKRNKKDNYIHNSLSYKEKFS